MKDKLEKYVSDNKSLFDDQEPGNELWNKIASGIDKPKVRKFNWAGVIWKVAAVILIFVASYFFHDLVKQGNRNSVKYANKGRESIFIKRKVNKVIEHKVEQPVYLTYMNPVKPNKINVQKTNDNVAGNNELTEVKAYYSTKISERENEIYKYTAYNPDIKKQIRNEFIQMDSIYSSLRKDLKDNINNKEVVEAMIQNYRIRLDILENMLQQIKGNESTEKKPHYEI